MELKITKEKVLEAASKCSTAKATLETLFPECFVKDKYFLFPNEFTVKTSETDPLIIAFNLAPDGMRNRCLYVRPGFDVEIIKEQGRTFIAFKTK